MGTLSFSNSHRMPVRVCEAVLILVQLSLLGLVRIETGYQEAFGHRPGRQVQLQIYTLFVTDVLPKPTQAQSLHIHYSRLQLLYGARSRQHPY